MAKKLDLKALMRDRAPAVKRKVVTPVDLYEAGNNKDKERTENRTGGRAVNRTDRRTPDRTTERPTERSNERDNERPTERTNTTRPALLAELESGLVKSERAKERYSFEAYSDQVEQLAKLQALYRQKTKGKVTISRMIRDALDTYLASFEGVLK